MAKLIFIGEKFNGRVYEFAVDKTSVGRGNHNTLTIQDASVSHSHAEVLVFGTEVIVRDLGSSNGTYVNGVRLHNQQRPMLAGQIVEFGSVPARLELDSPSTTDTVTDVTAVYSHARHLRELQNVPKPPAPAFTTLETGPASPAVDHTLMLPRAMQTEATSPPPTPAPNAGVGDPPRKIPLPVIVAALVLGLAILLWLILGWSK